MTINITLSPQNNVTDSIGTDLDWLIGKNIRISLIIAYSLISIIGITGNCTVLIILSNKKYRRTSGDVFLMSLAVFDILASFFIPLLMIHDMVNLKWSFGNIGCKVLPSFNILTLFASAWSLVLISYDRLRVILHPFHLPLSNFKKCLCISLIWVMSIAASCPYAYVHHVDFEGYCWPDWNGAVNQYVYFVIMFIFICIIPSLTMVCTYVMSILNIRRTKLYLGKVQTEYRNKENAKVLKMFILIVVVFISLITPYFINLMIIAYSQAYEIEFLMKHNTIFRKLNYSLFTMAAFNSCANCLIYAKMHSQVRKKICKMNCPGRRINSTEPYVVRYYRTEYID